MAVGQIIVCQKVDFRRKKPYKKPKSTFMYNIDYVYGI